MIATKTFFLKTKKIHIIKEGRKYDYSRYCDQICIFVCTYYIDFDVAKNIKIVFSSLNVFYICFAVDKISSYLIIFITIICILRCLVYYHFKKQYLCQLIDYVEKPHEWPMFSLNVHLWIFKSIYVFSTSKNELFSSSKLLLM